MIHDESYNFSNQDFSSIDLDNLLSNIESPSYLSVVMILNEQRASAEENGLIRNEKVYRLLAAVSGMMLTPDSINAPFTPYANLGNGRSSSPEDLTSNELDFFESILSDFENLWMKARLADLLWLCQQPRNPTFARIAVNAYMSLPSEFDGVHVDKIWERAARISLQIRDHDQIEAIEASIIAEFRRDSDHKYKKLRVAKVLDKLSFAADINTEIADSLYAIAQSDLLLDDFHGVDSYLTLAAEKYKQAEENELWIEVLIKKAECFERHAEQFVDSSAMSANHFFEMAIQAYREIPRRYRGSSSIDEKIEAIRAKLTDSGHATLSEMTLQQGPDLDISALQEVSRNHVSSKESLQVALMYFTGVCAVQSYDELVNTTLENISPLSSLFGNTRYSSDGRVSARTEPLDFDEVDANTLPDNQLFDSYMIGVGLCVQGSIVPALRVIVEEHWVTLTFLEELCYLSPAVANNRVKLTAMALWRGFEFDFRNSITLLCPQIENMVRLRLKEYGATTSNLDRNGIEHENGMSTLLDLEQAPEVFGIDHVFEMKAIFTNSYGANLRNEVAHGLLDDDHAGSAPSVYAWWMILRVILEPFTKVH